MSDERSMLVESVTRMLRDHCTQKHVDEAKPAGWSPQLWAVLEEAQVPLLGIPESAGGAGGTLDDMAAVIRLAGEHAAPVPLAETGMLAGWMLAASGARVPRGPLTAGPVRRGERLALARDGAGWTLSGSLRGVPFAAAAARLVVLAHDGAAGYVCIVDPAACRIARGENMASEARNDVTFDAVKLRADDVVPAGAGVDAEALLRRGALSRSLLIAGALDRCLELSIAHARTRVQFGRPIAKFQAIQQEIARLGGEVAAAGAAAMSAAGAEARGRGEEAVASAKIRCGEAALTGSEIAHQVHGAIGVTQEFVLHLSTLRLAAWRSEFGSEAQWAAWLGRRVRARGADRFWPVVSDA